MDRDRSPDPSLDQRQLADLAALRAAADRRRGLVPGTAAHQAALDEERSIAKRIRTWASRQTSQPRDAAGDPATSSTPQRDPTGGSPSGDALGQGRGGVDEG